MEKSRKNNKHTRRVRNLILICLMSALLLTVGTYAWFIGMQTVKVNAFEVNISGVDSLMLSMDGVTWKPAIQPTDVENFPGYDGNANEFLADEGEGLKPISTIGKFNTTASRLNLYEKGSLTATTGGYRLLASKVDNYTKLAKKEDGSESTEYLEGDGYVAFDMFVMNFSGDEYYEDVKPGVTGNEEAIYLTYDSKVTKGEAGADLGIQNSVRVAFAPIARIKGADYYSLDANEDSEKIETLTGMTCTTQEGVYTGLCSDAIIWEPNAKAHTTAAKTWYTSTCKARKEALDAQTSKPNQFSYEANTACVDLDTVQEASLDNEVGYARTAAVSDVITSGDYTDIYDGPYNKYSIDHSPKLVQVDTFTSFEQAKTGVNRQAFMYLAPNSITKIRVYIWIEGQDVDNYDFASLGNSIVINFGLTKERITAGEIDSTIDPSTGPDGSDEGYDWEKDTTQD